MFARIASSAAFVAAMAFGQTVDAQTASNCGPRADLLKQLSSKCRESPVAIGVADNGSLLEVLASTDGATWTALVSRANGYSCVVMSGEDWQSRAPQLMVRLPL